MQWKIYYADGSSYYGEPELAPKRGVQAILIKDELVGRRIESSRDYYVYWPERGGWRSVDHFAFYEYLFEANPPTKIVLFGSVMDDGEYRALWDIISNDPDLPPKSGFLKDERKP